MKIGYIQEIDLELNPHSNEKFKFREATFTRRISSRGDRVYSKLLLFPVDYEEIVDNANIMKNNSDIILTREPFLLDDELRKKCVRWAEWANKADESEYSFFCISRWVRMKDRRPCIHGDLCREIYKLTGRIYSIRCPYGCKFYEPVKIAEKGDVK